MLDFRHPAAPFVDTIELESGSGSVRLFQPQGSIPLDDSSNPSKDPVTGFRPPSR